MDLLSSRTDGSDLGALIRQNKGRYGVSWSGEEKRAITTRICSNLFPGVVGDVSQWASLKNEPGLKTLSHSHNNILQDLSRFARAWPSPLISRARAREAKKLFLTLGNMLLTLVQLRVRPSRFPSQTALEHSHLVVEGGTNVISASLGFELALETVGPVIWSCILATKSPVATVSLRRADTYPRVAHTLIPVVQLKGGQSPILPSLRHSIKFFGLA